MFKATPSNSTVTFIGTFEDCFEFAQDWAEQFDTNVAISAH